MSIRDIIEAAPKRTVYNDCSDCSMARLDDDECALCEDAYERQRRFIAAFDPEHVALMEAVIQAAEEWVRECRGAEYQDDGCTADSWGECERPCAARVHLTNLQAYRKEHGL